MDMFTLTPAELPHAWALVKMLAVFAFMAIVVAVLER
jgi:hypothetical protein